jgi:hypothetical protein
MYGDPRPGAASPAAVQAKQMLRAHVRRVAEAGRLRVGEELAVDLFHAAACGTVLTLLAVAEKERDPALSPLTCETALAAITTDMPAVPVPDRSGRVALGAAAG